MVSTSTVSATSTGACCTAPTPGCASGEPGASTRPTPGWSISRSSGFAANPGQPVSSVKLRYRFDSTELPANALTTSARVRWPNHGASSDAMTSRWAYRSPSAELGPEQPFQFGEVLVKAQ